MIPPANFPPQKPKKNTLILWSSGLDSTGALVHMLTNTDDNIYVHRIVLDNREGRSIAEDLSAKKILAYLREHYRPFVYTESSFSKPGYVHKDMYVYMHTAGLLAIEHGIRKKPLNRVVTGSIKMFSATTGVEKRRARAWKIFEATYWDNRRYEKCEWYLPLKDKTKEDVYNSLPKDLTDMCWSCRTPKYASDNTPISCTKCPACMAVKRIRGELTPEQIKKYRRWNE